MKKLFIVLLLFMAGAINAQDVYERGNITDDTLKVKELQVTGSYTAVKKTPFSFTNVDNSEINERDAGTEPALLLSKTPSVIYHSDNGLGTGYIYYRLRGIDQTRINSTLNGVPMNEPEDQGIYYNNYYNFLGSVDNIQVIRGAGMTKSGVSSYGGSMNFNSQKFSDKRLTVNAGIFGGSYNSSGVNVGVSTPNFFINGSRGTTDGFKNNTFNKSKSVFYGAKSENIEFYGFVANQKNGMGWLGEPLDLILQDPQYNSNTPDETDDFTYVHNQLHWKNNNLKLTLYHTYIHGWYDTDIAHFDPTLSYGELMNRIELQSSWFGTILNYNLKLGDFLNTNYGVSAYTYYRDHYGYYNNEYAYDNRGIRREVSPYAKGEMKIGRLSLYGDAQFRHSIFAYNGYNEFDTQKYNFFNWSGGTSLRLGSANVYYGVGRTHREPTRTDLFSGWDDYDPAFYNPTMPETVLDHELGVKYVKGDLNFTTNVYYMDFENEIVLNGQYGPNSILLHQNVEKSFRSGLEIDLTYSLSKLELSGVGNFSHNRITEGGQTFEPVLTPSVILAGDAIYNFNKIIYMGLGSQYYGESYIDFANEFTLEPRFVLNGSVGLKFKRFSIEGKLNNLTNQFLVML
jgi:iron complex outermembrane receptor protein